MNYSIRDFNSIFKIHGFVRALIFGFNVLLILAIVQLGIGSSAISAEFVSVDSVSGHAGVVERNVFAWKFVPLPYEPGESADRGRVNDILAANEMGLTGFALEAYTYGHALELLRTWPAAADRAGVRDFKFFLAIDFGRWYRSGQSAAYIIDIVERASKNPHTFKIRGRVVLGTYGIDTQAIGAQWWKDNVILPLQQKSISIEFIPTLELTPVNRTEPSVANFARLISSFEVIDGAMLFGLPKGVPFYANDTGAGRQAWSGLETLEHFAAALHAEGRVFISPTSPYYWLVCQAERPYYEYRGGEGMEKYWNSVISKQHPEAVMLVTWDDYAESTYFSPSHYPITKFAEIESFTHIGFFELEKYYIAWYRSNVKPMINNDGIFYFYRTHPIHSESVTNAGHCGLSATRPEQIWGKVDDELFITTALKTAATLRVTSGSKVASYNMAPGLNSVSTPFFPGPQKFEIVRQGRTVVTAVGRPIDAQPSTFNLNQFSGFAFANGWQSLSWQPGSKRNQGPRSRWFEAR